jgi:hypothetical protein
MNLKEFLISQGKRAGLGDNQDFQMMVSASSLNDIEVPETIANQFNSSLMDSEIAKANPDLKKHFIGNYMMGYDQEVEAMAKEYGLPLEAVQEIRSTKNSGDKVKLAFKHLKSLEDAAKKSSSKGQSEEYVSQIAAAQKKLDDTLAQAEAEKRALESKYVGKMQSLWEQAQLSGVQWNDSIPDAARIPSYNAVMAQKMNELGGMVVFDAESYSGNVVNANDPSLPLVINGKSLAYKDVQALVLQENKLLRETGNGGSSSTSQQGTNGYVPPTKGTSTPLPSYVTGALAEISATAERAKSY